MIAQNSTLPSVHKLPADCIMCAAEISTAHITRKDREQLADNDVEVLAEIAGGYGHLLHFGDSTDIDEDFEHYSPEFRALLHTLRAAGFRYVRLDRDGAICRDLPTFD